MMNADLKNNRPLRSYETSSHRLWPSSIIFQSPATFTTDLFICFTNQTELKAQIFMWSYYKLSYVQVEASTLYVRSVTYKLKKHCCFHRFHHVPNKTASVINQKTTQNVVHKDRTSPTVNTGPLWYPWKQNGRWNLLKLKETSCNPIHPRTSKRQKHSWNNLCRRTGEKKMEATEQSMTTATNLAEMRKVEFFDSEQNTAN